MKSLKPKQEVKESKTTVEKKEKVAYKPKNWGNYNKSLVKRGSLTIWINEEAKENWNGIGYFTYSIIAIQTMLYIKYVYNLPYRQLTGFVSSIFEMLGLILEVPDYTTICKRNKKLECKLKVSNKKITDIIIDSTGIKVYGEGEWKVRKHGWNYRRLWMKLHMGISETGEIRAVVMTDNKSHDMKAYTDILNQETAQIKTIYGDGAYDAREAYEDAEKRGIDKVCIPPRDNARITEKGHPTRNKHIKEIQEKGKKAWKECIGYHVRSRVESTMFRYKKTFGGEMDARTTERQKNELIMKCNILNIFHSFGMPESSPALVK